MVVAAPVLTVKFPTAVVPPTTPEKAFGVPAPLTVIGPAPSIAAAYVGAAAALNVKVPVALLIIPVPATVGSAPASNAADVIVRLAVPPDISAVPVKSVVPEKVVVPLAALFAKLAAVTSPLKVTLSVFEDSTVIAPVVTAPIVPLNVLVAAVLPCEILMTPAPVMSIA